MKIAHLVGVALLVLGTPWRSSADPITIQSGSLTATAAFDSLYISIVGFERGFTFDSRLSQTQGRFDPAGSVTLPGGTVGVGGQWSTGSFGGATVTLDGRTFPEGEQHVSGMQLRDPQAFFLLEGPRTDALPAGVAGDLITLEAPFSFGGFFNYVEDPSLPPSQLVWNRNALFGQGTSVLTYIGQAVGSPEQSFFTWRFRSAAYSFGAVAQTPEPWSVVLFGSGLIGLVYRLRRAARSPAE